jgi:drug/metabolite transporter (DMT)-like permease
MTTINRDYGLLLASLGVLFFTPDAALFRLTGANPWTLLVWRNVFTALAFLLWLLATTPRGSWRTLFVFDRLGWVAVFALAMSDIGFMNAVLNAPAADALVVLASSPLLAALIGWIAFAEPVPMRTWVAIAVALAAIALTLVGTAPTGGLYGCLMAFVAACGFSINLNALRFSKRAPAIPVVFLASLIVVPVSLAMCLMFDTPVIPSQSQMGLIAVLGLVLHPLSFGCISTATRYLPSAEIALVSLAETLLGPFWVWLLFRDVPSVTTVIGGTLIIATLLVHTLLSLSNRGQGLAPTV